MNDEQKIEIIKTLVNGPVATLLAKSDKPMLPAMIELLDGLETSSMLDVNTLAKCRQIGIKIGYYRKVDYHEWRESKMKGLKKDYLFVKSGIRYVKAID